MAFHRCNQVAEKATLCHSCFRLASSLILCPVFVFASCSVTIFKNVGALQNWATGAPGTCAFFPRSSSGKRQEVILDPLDCEHPDLMAPKVVDDRIANAWETVLLEQM